MSPRPARPLLAGALAIALACGVASDLTAQLEPRESLQQIILELDRVTGTKFPPESVTDSATNRRVTIPDLYAAEGTTGLAIRMIHDQTDLPAGSPWTIQYLDQLMHFPQGNGLGPTATRGERNRALEGRRDTWYLHQLIVDGEFGEDESVAGIIIDRGERVGTAVFYGTLQTFFGAFGPERVGAELFLTSVHEMGHSLNLHHADWEGSEFEEGSTIMGYSSAVSVLWTFSHSSLAHLAREGDHPVEFVQPGPFAAPFGEIAHQHCDAHPHRTHSATIVCR